MSIFELVQHSRFPDEYMVCKNTGLHFYKKAVERQYSDSYFLEEFKSQYNKTYYEDEENLRALARKRLKVLSKFTVPSRSSILEIGSAAGFFLDEAQKLRFKVKGVEISRSETNYAKGMGLDVIESSFLEFESNETFDCICAFFVIEHFRDQETVWKKISSLLAPGGLLFLALPSLHGPSFETNPKAWFETHPTDHFVDYSPKSIERVMQKFSMNLVWKKPMSYHPSRAMNWRGKFPFRKIYNNLADLSSYGDTIQVIGKKNEVFRTKST
ncbi:MAG: class I SAM-dependent methyltransferase [Leptospiraceae bacterium]|nr:class I SAM-dependent methyltransferase [Leptospiraceae bacterium]